MAEFFKGFWGLLNRGVRLWDALNWVLSGIGALGIAALFFGDDVLRQRASNLEFPRWPIAFVWLTIVLILAAKGALHEIKEAKAATTSVADAAAAHTALAIETAVEANRNKWAAAYAKKKAEWASADATSKAKIEEQNKQIIALVSRLDGKHRLRALQSFIQSRADDLRETAKFDASKSSYLTMANRVQFDLDNSTVGPHVKFKELASQLEQSYRNSGWSQVVVRERLELLADALGQMALGLTDDQIGPEFKL